jgi:hypothetical protein
MIPQVKDESSKAIPESKDQSSKPSSPVPSTPIQVVPAKTTPTPVPQQLKLEEHKDVDKNFMVDLPDSVVTSPIGNKLPSTTNKSRYLQVN